VRGFVWVADHAARDSTNQPELQDL
jgi:hypothetical protein